MLIDDYIIDQHGFDWPKLLESWFWLLPKKFVVWIMNRFGDLFIVLDDGTVHKLDIGCGTLTQVAESREDFIVKIDKPGRADDWLMIPLVDRMVAAGKTLTEGQCYGFRVPPVLGGKYDDENIVVISIQDFLAAYGSIHEQIKDVPDGERVVLEIIENNDT